MIDFKPLSIDDRNAVTAFTLTSDRRNCDFAFANLCSWQFLYHTQWAVSHDCLLMKFYAHDELAYMLPTGNGDLRKAVEALMADAQAENQPFQMHGLSDDMVQTLEAAMPGQFTYRSSRDYADYIYLHDDLSQLRGNKFQSKRNFVHRFMRNNPDWQYEPLTAEHVQKCLELEAEWCKINHCDQQEGTGNERRAIEFALTHFEQLGLTGGALYADGNMVAFTYGSPVTHSTFAVHAEKADTRVEGAYATINNQFALHLPDSFTLINREEDLDIEGLRKAKLSYNPVTILEKSTACIIEKQT